MRYAANGARPPPRRGPEGACSDSTLLEHIRSIIKVSPFSGEGYRKVWARWIMKHNNLLAPQRPLQRDAHPHDGTIVTARVDQVWGTDMTQTITTGEGRAYVFIAVEHSSGEFVGTHASSSASRWEALEPIRQGVTRHFGGAKPDTALGLILRHDHGSNYMADDFQGEIKRFGITSSPSFVRQPEGNGVSERAIRMLKEQLLWVHRFATVE
jgi:putative transposase